MTLKESLSFYRSLLPKHSKPVYDCLYREIKKDMTALCYQFSVLDKVTLDECSSAYLALIMDHPELYLLEYGIVNFQ